MSIRTAATLTVLALLAGTAQAAPTPSLAPSFGPLTGARLMQITLPVKDLDRAVAFYRDVLGVKVLLVVRGAAFLDAGGVRLRLEKNETAVPSGGVEIYFDDPGMSRLKPLAERGVKFAGPPETVNRVGDMDTRLAEFFDPDGNALGLMGDVRRP